MKLVGDMAVCEYDEVCNTHYFLVGRRPSADIASELQLLRVTSMEKLFTGSVKEPNWPLTWMFEAHKEWWL